MNAGTTIIILWYFSSLFIHQCLTVSEKEGLYPTIVQEYHTMVAQLYDGMLPVKNCKNACIRGGEIKAKRNTSSDDCRCDKQCVEFGDCCLDYWQSCNSSFAKAYDQQRIFQCLLPRLRLVKSNQTEDIHESGVSYQVVVKCPSIYRNARVKRSCENPVHDDARSLPFVEGTDGRTYRNQHCAVCHGVAAWHRWETTLRCPQRGKSPVSDILARLRAGNFSFTDDERKRIRENCRVDMKRVNGTRPIPCNRAKLCENKTNPDYTKCHIYKQFLYNMKHHLPIGNPHCARCMNMGFTALFLMNMFRRTQGTKPRNSMGILFDFSKASDIYGKRKPQKIRQQCGDGTLYDITLKACRSQRIANMVTFENWTCELDNETFPNISQHFVLLENRSIFVHAHDQVYGPERYHWHGANVTVCGNFTKQFMKVVQRKTVLYSGVDFYITLVGFSLSILALLVVILTYSLFSELRTLPGKIVINLAVALLLSQLVFVFDMVNDVSGDVCFGIAIVLHYLFVASFCWMNVMAFDVSRTFTGKGHRSPTSSRGKLFLLYLLYAWGFPLLIVAVTLVVNEYGGLHVGYGNDYYCWITNPIALAVFFAVPVVTMILFNVVSLVRVLVAVRRVRKVTKKVRDKSTGQDISMCWKLTAVFGLTWILGLGAGYNVAIRIVYIVCNSLQGVFIMIGFIMTRRILNMYLKKAGKEPLSTRSFSQKSTVINTTLSTNRKISATRLVEYKVSHTKQREPTEAAEEAAIDDDSPEARLIASLEGPETKL